MGVYQAAWQIKRAWQGRKRSAFLWIFLLIAGGAAVFFALRETWLLFPFYLPDRYVPILISRYLNSAFLPFSKIITTGVEIFATPRIIGRILNFGQ